MAIASEATGVDGSGELAAAACLDGRPMKWAILAASLVTPRNVRAMGLEVTAEGPDIGADASAGLSLGWTS